MKVMLIKSQFSTILKKIMKNFDFLTLLFFFFFKGIIERIHFERERERVCVCVCGLDLLLDLNIWDIAWKKAT